MDNNFKKNMYLLMDAFEQILNLEEIIEGKKYTNDFEKNTLYTLLICSILDYRAEQRYIELKNLILKKSHE